MVDLPNQRNDNKHSNTDTFTVRAPAVSLPKGGGAIRGMGEKFAANPVTGTASVSIPIFTSAGRAGFGPALSLSYDSGAGNGAFGFGWNLSIPRIARKTDKGLPKYFDADELDTFILSGAEDLVPALIRDNAGEWVRDVVAGRVVGGRKYDVQRYRPRTDSLFARIEHWVNTADAKESFWRSITRDNVTSWYGRTEEQRIADPKDATRIFAWLLCETYDDKGNVIVYRYKAENEDDVDLSQAHEANRAGDNARSANRYLKRVRYGNHEPYLPELTETGAWPALPSDDRWFFEVVFDYGEHDADRPLPSDSANLWRARVDPFSSYRSGFEVRTHRLCQRVLMFHHFPAEPQVGADCLVRSTDFTYSYEDDPANAQNPVFSFLRRVQQTGYQRSGATSYLAKSLPPIDFEYTAVLTAQELQQQPIHEIEDESLENLPYGLDGLRYQWLDLDGEGLSGILVDHGEAWLYKGNLSPLTHRTGADPQTIAKLGPIERVGDRPSLAASNRSRRQFLDLAGDGQLDLVELARPTAGFYERAPIDGWQTFVPFQSHPILDWDNPNLRLVDLTGDGHADILISEDDAFCWHQSLAEAGFAPPERVRKLLDEEKGPHLIFADSMQSVYLADMSGDGLTDLVRIRNGEVCYWPNLGYCRFGAKVTMDNAPYYDAPDLFDQRRIRLADIDGSGVTDILYLHGDGVQIYFNQSGNSWSAVRTLHQFPRIDDLSSVAALDLLGVGTACLVWSSPLAADARAPIRYIELMGQKPHLLLKVSNNLGAETTIQYAPSTRFYLADKQGGKPWITRLPFPVQCVEKVTISDRWRQSSFSTTYSYHHGYFDGHEREFRGFGRVEQVDIESYGTFAAGSADSPYITADKTLYQPPVKTVTWHHTGAFLEGGRILSQFSEEYFPNWFEAITAQQENVLGDFQENVLPEPDLSAADLTAEEWREAVRACKGIVLRQEIYELDVDALEQGEHRAVKLFTARCHNCHIQRLQPGRKRQPAVFLATESESISYQYELDLKQATVRPDPRISHKLNLRLDEYANVLQAVAVVYPRLGEFDSNELSDTDKALIRDVQSQAHIAYTETRYTDDFGDRPEDKEHVKDNYRLRVPCEVLTYELTGVAPEDAGDSTTEDLRDNFYFSIDELRDLQLSTVHQSTGNAVTEIPYHKRPTSGQAQKRPVEHVRMLYFRDAPEAPGALAAPLPLGQLGRLGLPYETYKLALTTSLLESIFVSATANKLDQPVRGTLTARQLLADSSLSGYCSGAELASLFATVPATELLGQYWIRSGVVGFAADAAQHFYLPERFKDPFGHVTTLQYDPRALFVQSRSDALGNTTSVIRFDFRAMAFAEVKDINDNLSQIVTDALGIPTALVLKGKGTEGDNLAGFDVLKANPPSEEINAFFSAVSFSDAQPRAWLANTTARYVYHFGETHETLADGSKRTRWGVHPASACEIRREHHVAQLAPGELCPIQIAFAYTDGLGSVIVTKAQASAEVPGQPLRWIARGKTVLNNKGKPVKQYEPYFSEDALGQPNFRFEEPIEIGVTPLIYYDAIGRVIRTEAADGSYSRVEFSPWELFTYDANDTVSEPGNAWFARKTAPTASAEEKRSAQLAAEHADTPAFVALDSLGREVVSVAHNRTRDSGGALKDERYLTFTHLDIEGKVLWIRDARRNLVMQYISPAVPSDHSTDPTAFTPCYDIAGNLLFQHGTDAGSRWMLPDAAGAAMLTWDSQGHTVRVDYDELHRPAGAWVIGSDPLDRAREIQFEKTIYGDTPGNGLADATQLNLRGQRYRHHDTAGIVIMSGHNPTTTLDEAFDFKGNVLRARRQFVVDYAVTPDWSRSPTLATEIFENSTRYDALGRALQVVAPHSDGAQAGGGPAKLSVIRPGYDAGSQLTRLDVWLEQLDEPASLLSPATATEHVVASIAYNSKGQRGRIVYGNGIATTYEYDPSTFRLTRLQTTRGAEQLQDLLYTYDPSGNITHTTDRAQDRVFHSNACVEAGSEFRYDALYRLVTAKGREHAGGDEQPASDDSSRIVLKIPNDCHALRTYVQTYRYDAVGNILQMLHCKGQQLDSPGQVLWNRKYQYANDSNRLLSSRLPGEADNLPDYAAAPGYGASYAYDKHGSMLSTPHLPQMHWDFKNHLRSTRRQVVAGGGPAAPTFYVYDSSGTRVRKVTQAQDGAVREERIYLGEIELYRRYGVQGISLERESLHVVDNQRRVALIETRTHATVNDPAPRQLVRYQHSNHLDSSLLELDKNANVISYEEYHPYGSTAYRAARNQTDTPKRYCYTGKERDEESGLYYHGARYYAPWLARWTATDPAGLVDGLNLYVYASDSPARFSDPGGTQSLEEMENVHFRPDNPNARKNLAAFIAAAGGICYDEDKVPYDVLWKAYVDVKNRLQASNRPHRNEETQTAEPLSQPYDRRRRMIIVRGADVTGLDPMVKEYREVYATPEEAEEMEARAGAEFHGRVLSAALLGMRATSGGPKGGAAPARAPTYDATRGAHKPTPAPYGGMLPSQYQWAKPIQPYEGKALTDSERSKRPVLEKKNVAVIDSTVDGQRRSGAAISGSGEASESPWDRRESHGSQIQHAAGPEHPARLGFRGEVARRPSTTPKARLRRRGQPLHREGALRELWWLQRVHRRDRTIRGGVSECHRHRDVWASA